jgi:hypothetical protein
MGAFVAIMMQCVVCLWPLEKVTQTACICLQQFFHLFIYHAGSVGDLDILYHCFCSSLVFCDKCSGPPLVLQ